MSVDRAYYETSYHFDEDVRQLDERRLGRALDLLEPFDRATFLDLGSGVGWAARLALRRGASHAIGLDFADRALRLGQAHVPEVARVQGDGCLLPVRSGTVDRVLSFGSLEHFPDVEEGLREIARVLAPGGRAVVVVPNFYVRTEQPRELRLSLARWTRLVERAGLRVTATGTDVGPPVRYDQRPLRTVMRAGAKVLSLVPPLAYQLILALEPADAFRPAPADGERSRQLEYSTTQAAMLDDTSRRAKAAKIVAVVRHFRGSEDLTGLRVVDCGCSGGIIADSLHAAGATVVGLDIDVPGLASARARFGDSVSFVCADSEQMPLASASVDLAICNHVYEHVVSPDRLFAELRRVVRPDGMLYLGLGNRYGVVEPHYKLPFLSWLPRGLAHRYVRASGRADRYHEQFASRAGLRRLCAGLHVWDYTYAALAEPDRFAAGDEVPGWASRVPGRAFKLAQPVVPTFLWVATPRPAEPQGPALRVAPERVPTPSG